MIWAWGQFLDHEMDLTSDKSGENINITTPANDEFQGRTIPFTRSSHNSGSRHNYMVGLSALNDYCNKTRNKQFSRLSKDLQNSILQAVQANKIEGFAPSAAGFFNMVRNHTIDGTFCDPYYGGNQNFVGWDMVRYPGIRLGASETDVAKGALLQPNHQSAYDHSTYTKIASNIDTKSGTTKGSDHA